MSIDRVTNGECCLQCGIVMGSPTGDIRKCDDCKGGYMSDKKDITTLELIMRTLDNVHIESGTTSDFNRVCNLLADAIDKSHDDNQDLIAKQAAEIAEIKERANRAANDERKKWMPICEKQSCDIEMLRSVLSLCYEENTFEEQQTLEETINVLAATKPEVE